MGKICVLLTKRQRSKQRQQSTLEHILLLPEKSFACDFDSQGNISSSVGDKDKPTVYELLIGHVSAEQTIKRTVVRVFLLFLLL